MALANEAEIRTSYREACQEKHSCLLLILQLLSSYALPLQTFVQNEDQTVETVSQADESVPAEFRLQRTLPSNRYDQLMTPANAQRGRNELQ